MKSFDLVERNHLPRPLAVSLRDDPKSSYNPVLPSSYLLTSFRLSPLVSPFYRCLDCLRGASRNQVSLKQFTPYRASGPVGPHATLRHHPGCSRLTQRDNIGSIAFISVMSIHSFNRSKKDILPI